MREIYGCCDLYVHPSSVEGFGFPLLEAMACGCPVLHTADGGVMEEVCGDAGVAVPPAAWAVSSFGSHLHILDPQVLADAIRGLYTEEKERVDSWERRRAKALHRASAFPWQRTESAVLDLLANFLKS